MPYAYLTRPVPSSEKFSATLPYKLSHHQDTAASISPSNGVVKGLAEPRAQNTEYRIQKAVGRRH
jgi:hypothetical protein